MLINQKGISIVEILITIGLAAILFPALLTGFVATRGGRAQQDERIQATSFLKETQEAVRQVREKDWNNFAALSNPPNQIYHPALSGFTWSLVSGFEEVNGLTRQITISDVYRGNTSGDIVPSSGPTNHLDPSTKKVVFTVNWGQPLPSSINTTEYLTRYFGNAAETQTETVEPAAGFGDWCRPQLTLTNIDLDRQGHPTSIRAFESSNGTGNRVLAGTGANSSGPAFTNIQVLGNTPPVATNLGEYNGTPQVKVNGVFGDTHYAFLATDNRGVEILDLTTTPPFQKIGSFNPGGMKKVHDVYVVGDTGYAVTEDKFYIFSISSNRQTATQIGVALNLADGARVIVDPTNQYAYVPTPDANGELKIIDVHTHPTNLTADDIKNVNVDGGSGRDVFISGNATRAYLATAASPAKPEFFIIDISDKANPVVITNGGTYDTNGMDAQGVVVVSGQRAIIAGLGGREYQVFSVANDTVSFCPNHDQNSDFLDIDSGVYSVSSVLQSDEHAYSYIATGDSSAELKIIEGGAGGGGGGGTGTFESTTFDAGHDVAFNYFSATVDPNLTYKISIKPGSGGNCSGVTFADSDFTTFSPGALPLTTIGSGYVNPGQCLKYRAVNSGSTAITFTVTFNYSP